MYQFIDFAITDAPGIDVLVAHVEKVIMMARVGGFADNFEELHDSTLS
jgi:hypothetical protein